MFLLGHSDNDFAPNAYRKTNNHTSDVHGGWCSSPFAQNRCFLSDLCQSCGKPISILKLSLNMKLNQCFHCGSFIEPNTYLVEEAGQNTLLRIAHGEWPILGNKHIHPILYFRILSYAFRLIGCSRFSIGFQQELGQEVLNIPKFKDEERYNTRCRHALIQMSLKLLSNWPHNFIDICHCVGITRNRLLKVKFDLSFELHTQLFISIVFLLPKLAKETIF